MKETSSSGYAFVGAILVPATLLVSYVALVMDHFIYEVYILKSYTSSEGPYFVYGAIFWNIIAVLLIYSTIKFFNDIQKHGGT